MSDIRTFKTAVISAALASANTIIAADANRGIKVWAMAFTTAAANTVVFKAGTTALSGTLVFGGNGAMTLDYTGAPWFYCPPNTAFVATLTTTDGLGGVVLYSLE